MGSEEKDKPLQLKQRKVTVLNPDSVGIKSVEQNAMDADKRTERLLRDAAIKLGSADLRTVDIVEYFETKHSAANQRDAMEQGSSWAMLRRYLEDYFNPALWIYLFSLGTIVAVICFVVDYGSVFLSRQRRTITARLESQSEFLALAFWTLSSITLGCLSHACVVYISPAAKGGGIAEVKAIIGGVVLHQFLSFRALVGRFTGLTLALGSGMSVGKEGPFVHIAANVCHLLYQSEFFKNKLKTAGMKKQMLQAATASGVTATFQSPIGGPLFSLEVTSSFYTVSSLWKTWFCAVVTVLFYLILHHAARIDLWNITVFDEYKINYDLFPIIALGVLTGVTSGLFVKIVAMWMLLWRQKKWFISGIWTK
jgi:chloride channel 2